MKKFLTLCAIASLSMLSFAQTPERIPEPGPELDALKARLKNREERKATAGACPQTLSLSSSPIVVLGGKFIAGEGIKPIERFDAMLKSEFKITAPVSILGGSGTTSSLILGNLPSIMANYQPKALVLDLAVEDLKAGIKRNTTFENLAAILEKAETYNTNVFVVIGPSSLNLKKDSRPDNAYAALADRYGFKTVLGGQVNVEDAISYVEESTPGVVAQYKFAQALAAGLKSCAPAEEATPKK